MNIKQVESMYQHILSNRTTTYFSPGRINIIGEHIDYLGGNVFPSAISLGTYGIVSKRSDRIFTFTSHNFPDNGTISISLDDLSYKEMDGWVNYPKGMIQTYKEFIPHGLDIVIYGTLPNSSGLSSSASLEVLIGYILKIEFNINITNLDIVLASKEVENNYIGVNCGIMDQFSIGMAKENHAIYLNTETLEYKQVPLILGDYKLIIANTNKQRSLSDSKYNERVTECNEALSIISKSKQLNELCDLEIKDLNQIQKDLPHILYNRVEHAVTENQRTKQAVRHLQNNNIVELGELLYESHNSLRDLYEVSCLELDTLVDAFKEIGAVGSRMIGAGFGGCTLAIIHKDKIEETINYVSKKYKGKIGYNADIYIVHPSGGPKIIKEGETL